MKKVLFILAFVALGLGLNSCACKCYTCSGSSEVCQSQTPYTDAQWKIITDDAKASGCTCK